MTRLEILEFMRGYSLAVQASVSPLGAPQAAVVGFIVTDDFEIVFDTIETTRKIVNLRRNVQCALVIGGIANGDERTVQFEGIADEPVGDDLLRLKELYLVRFPEARERQLWRGLTYVRVRPQWLRFSDFNQSPIRIIELTF
ncbi:MAG TPA: pyridoxamine 5'-phosphate oxidase family protein [Terriglobales bacterium]|nr:pyridoxamine 5'-phosphate oxidase family protein [Terriglobales bacterium]